MKATVILVLILAGLFFIGWLGLRMAPPPFPPFEPLEPTPAVELITLPEGLPGPVADFYRQLYGEQLPLVSSAVISGRGRLRVNGITFPARFRFTHVAGKEYRHYIEATFFGLPLMKVNEHYLDGRARLELPFGISEGPQVDQGANLALWAEAVLFPSLWLSDPAVRWEPLDGTSARLVVPDETGDGEEGFIVRFDPHSRYLTQMESMRFKGPDSAAKTGWLNEALTWDPLNGYPAATVTAVTWLDEESPWAIFYAEEIVLNADVDRYIREKGP